MPVGFVKLDHDISYIFLQSVENYLSEDHLARFVAEIIDPLDMSGLPGVYAGKGKKPYDLEILVALLFYGYATGTFSSRKPELLNRNTGPVTRTDNTLSLTTELIVLGITLLLLYLASRPLPERPNNSFSMFFGAVPHLLCRIEDVR